MSRTPGADGCSSGRDDLLRNYSKVSPSAAKDAWEFLYSKSETKCGHTSQQHCSGPACTFQRRIHNFHSEWH